MTEQTNDELLRMLEVALASDDPTIKRALKKLLFIVALVEGDATVEDGLISDMQRRIRELEAAVVLLQMEKRYSEGSATVGSGTISSAGTVWTTAWGTSTAPRPKWYYNK